MNDRQVDQVLVERAQKGDSRAFELLVSKYQRRLTRLLFRFIKDEHEVNDVAQEAFIKAYRALPNFRGDSAFYTWLYRIAINTAKNFLVVNGRQPVIQGSLATDEGELLDLTEQMPDYRTPDADIYAVYPKRHQLSTRIRTFVDELVAAFAHLNAGGGCPSAAGLT